MTATFIVNGDGTTTVQFEYTAANQRVLDTAGDAAHLLFDQHRFVQPDPDNPLTFDELTNQQKLNLLDAYVLKSILSIAKQYYVEYSIAVARDDAVTDTETRYI